MSYIAGGLIPLAPYMLLARPMRPARLGRRHAGGFGRVRFRQGRLTGISPWRGGLQTVVTGGLAAGAAFGIARAIA